MNFSDFRKTYLNVMGIYKVTCKVNGRAIIGSSVRVGSRVMRAYCWSANKNKCHNKSFQEDFNLYGPEFFNCELLKEIKDSKDLIRIEDIYIKSLPNLYNVESVKEFYIDDNIIKVFWKNLDIQGEDDCWNYQGYINEGDRYGKIMRKGKLYACHRISYFLHNGPFEPSLLVCHSCDNKQCCNPKHLFLGSSHDNSKDMYEKGLNCLITREMATDIRQQFLNGLKTSKELFKYFQEKYPLINVAQSSMDRIISNTTKYDPNWTVPNRYPKTKLSQKLINELRSKYKFGSKIFELAKEYNMKYTTVQSIVRNLRCKDPNYNPNLT